MADPISVPESPVAPVYVADDGQLYKLIGGQWLPFDLPWIQPDPVEPSTVDEWLDVTGHFHLEYRRSPGVDVFRGNASGVAPHKTPAFSIGMLRFPHSFFLDAYVRWGNGVSTWLAGQTSQGLLQDGWDLVCYDPLLSPGGAGGIGICEIHSSDPQEGDQLGMSRWYRRPDGKFAVEPKLFQTYGFTSGNISWAFPRASGHSIFEFPGSYLRMTPGPSHRALGGA